MMGSLMNQPQVSEEEVSGRVLPRTMESVSARLLAPQGPLLGSQGYDAPNATVKPDVPGTLDLKQRPLVLFKPGQRDAKGNLLGDYGSEYSMTYADTKRGVAAVLPAIFDGKLHTQEEALAKYEASNGKEHTGPFNLAKEENTGYARSEKYTTQLHEREQTLNGKLYRGPARSQVIGGR